MSAFISRNLKVFFRDKSAVFFSLLASLIIIGLYVLFLGDVWSQNLSEFPNSREVMDNWIMGGLIAVTTLTTTMGAFEIMITDKTKKIDKDFMSSPISRRSLAGGYIISSYIVGIILTLVTMVMAQIYILSQGGSLISASALLKSLAIIIISGFTNTSLILLMTSFFRSSSAFSTAGTVIGALIGFLTGIYIPIGSLPEPVQWLVKLFPPSHSAVLMRKVMMEDSLKEAFGGVPAEYAAEFKETMGVAFNFGDTEITVPMHLAFLIISSIVFFSLAVLNMSRKRKS